MPFSSIFQGTLEGLLRLTSHWMISSSCLPTATVSCITLIILSVILYSVTPSEAAPKPDTTPTTVPPTGSLPIPALAQTSFPYILLSHVSLQCLQPRRLRRRHQRNPQSRHLINKITFTHPVFQDGWNCDFEEMPLTRCRWDNSLGGKVLWEPTSGGDNPQVIFCYSQAYSKSLWTVQILPSYPQIRHETLKD